MYSTACVQLPEYVILFCFLVPVSLHPFHSFPSTYPLLLVSISKTGFLLPSFVLPKPPAARECTMNGLNSFPCPLTDNGDLEEKNSFDTHLELSKYLLKL